MRYLGVALAVLVAGCGNGSDTRVAAAFLTTQTADAVAARADKQPAAQAAGSAAAPVADAFHSHVSAVVATPTDAAEPEAIEAAPDSAPEDSEPVPL